MRPACQKRSQPREIGPRGRSHARPVAIVSCTGNADDEDKKVIAQCGADRVWGKPMPNFLNGELQHDLVDILAT